MNEATIWATIRRLEREIEHVEENRDIWLGRAQKYVPRDPEGEYYWEQVDECNDIIDNLKRQIEELEESDD